MLQSEACKPSSASCPSQPQPDVNVQSTITTTTDMTHNTQPNIDPATGDWLLSEFDVECIAIGAGILGCGGGGSPYVGKLRTLNLLRMGKEIRIIHPDRYRHYLGVIQNSYSFNIRKLTFQSVNVVSVTGPVGFVAFMGAPVILHEKLPSGEETVFTVQALRQRDEVS